MRVRVYACSLIIALGVVSIPICAFAADPEETFKSAIEHMQRRNYVDAVPLLEEVLEAYPVSPGALWNYGVATGEIGEFGKSLDAWKRYLTSAPDDWRAMTKIVQSYQGLGQTSNRDQAITELTESWSSTTDEKFKQTEKYCREQFVLDGTKFFVFEYFRPTGERQVFTEFIAVDSNGKSKYRMSLGSYQITNEVAWELGDLPRDKRLYHIDRYDPDEHATYAFFDERPSYDDLRKIVVNILEGKLEPSSSYTK